MGFIRRNAATRTRIGVAAAQSSAAQSLEREIAVVSWLASVKVFRLGLSSSRGDCVPERLPREVSVAREDSKMARQRTPERGRAERPARTRVKRCQRRLPMRARCMPNACIPRGPSRSDASRGSERAEIASLGLALIWAGTSQSRQPSALPSTHSELFLPMQRGGCSWQARALGGKLNCVAKHVMPFPLNRLTVDAPERLGGPNSARGGTRLRLSARSAHGEPLPKWDSWASARAADGSPQKSAAYCLLVNVWARGWCAHRDWAVRVDTNGQLGSGGGQSESSQKAPAIAREQTHPSRVAPPDAAGPGVRCRA